MHKPAAYALHRLFVGSYTDEKHDQGIYTILFDEANQHLQVVHQGGHAPNPSFIALHHTLLFAAHELSSRGMLAAYAIAPDGSLVFRGACSSPEDAGTCHVVVHPNGRFLYGSNYESGSVSCCTLTSQAAARSTGARLQVVSGGLPSVYHHGRSINPTRQRAPHVHTASFIPNTHVLAVVDLGLDTITLYQVDGTGPLKLPAQTIPIEAGSGPRMLAYHPTLPLTALINELGNDIMLFRYAHTQTTLATFSCPHWDLLTRLSLPTALPDGAKSEALAAHSAFSPDGTFLYASIRGSDRIVWFHLTPEGRLLDRNDVSSGGQGPRHFSLSPDGRFLATVNQFSNDVVIFARDAASGQLHEMCRISIHAPSCVVWG